MPYAAKVENDVVTNVIVGDVDWASARLGGEWMNVSHAVSVGYLYADGEFRPPAPYPSWTWDGSDYQPPTPMPETDDEHTAVWDEDSGKWVVVPLPPDEDE